MPKVTESVANGSIKQLHEELTVFVEHYTDFRK